VLLPFYPLLGEASLRDGAAAYSHQKMQSTLATTPRPDAFRPCLIPTAKRHDLNRAFRSRRVKPDHRTGSPLPVSHGARGPRAALGLPGRDRQPMLRRGCASPWRRGRRARCWGGCHCWCLGAAEPAQGVAQNKDDDDHGGNDGPRASIHAAPPPAIRPRENIPVSNHRGRAFDHGNWCGAGGRLLKSGALDHHAGHDLVGHQDIAWDIVGAVVELGLSRSARDQLCGVVEGELARGGPGAAGAAGAVLPGPSAG
jgi:hypothetical protein